MSFPRGCAWCWFKRTRLPPSPCPGGSYSFLYECYLRVERSHLHPAPSNRRGELPFLYERYLRFPRGCAWCWFNELVAHPFHAPVGVTHSCMNVTYELYELTSTPYPPSHREELPFLYECNLRIVYFPRGFVSHPQPPGGVSLSCVNVAYTVSFPRGCARCWFKRTRLQVGSHWSHERR